MAHAAGIKFPLDKQFTEHTSLSFDRRDRCMLLFCSRSPPARSNSGAKSPTI